MAEFHNASGAPSRRHIIKGLLTAGIATPAILRGGTAIRGLSGTGRCASSSPTRRAGPPTSSRASLAAALQEMIGGSVIVENRGGAGGNIGMGLAARAESDGYTLLLSTSAYSVNPGLYEKLPYDPFRDFVAVSELAIRRTYSRSSPNSAPRP